MDYEARGSYSGPAFRACMHRAVFHMPLPPAASSRTSSPTSTPFMRALVSARRAESRIELSSLDHALACFCVASRVALAASVKDSPIRAVASCKRGDRGAGRGVVVDVGRLPRWGCGFTTEKSPCRFPQWACMILWCFQSRARFDLRVESDFSSLPLLLQVDSRFMLAFE